MAIPVSLGDARRQLRMEVDDDSRDDEIAGWIADAAGWVEDYTGHILEAREVTEQFRAPARTIGLRSWPIKFQTFATVTYAGGTVVPDILVDVSARPARVAMPFGRCWPLTRSDQVLTVTVRAGYEAADAVPRNIRRAMLLLISAYDEDREGGDIFAKAEAAARRLCGSLRARRL